MGISGTTAKSRQRKFVPSSHTGPVALVASPGKNKTKVGTLACFKFFERMSKLCKNPAMLFHVDVIYLAKQAKLDVKKKLCFEMRTVTKSDTERDFFSLMSKRRKYADVLQVSAQNKSI